MAKKYQVNGMVRLVNRLTMQLMRWNIARPHAYLLTVRGRKTGKEYSVPVTILEQAGKRYLVPPYGEVNWVRNARVAGRVILTRGKYSETCSISQVSPEDSAPVLKEYLTVEPITRPYFDAGPDSPWEAFVADASRHPVFVLEKEIL